MHGNDASTYSKYLIGKSEGKVRLKIKHDNNVWERAHKLQYRVQAA